MARKLIEPKLVVASHNPGKLHEMGDLLAPFSIEAVSAGALGLPEPEETGVTFVENALLKAHASARASGLPALADDSGIAVDALGGDPGIYTARWAETPDGRDFRVAMERVEKAIDGHADRRAHFISVLALAWPDGHAETFEGGVDGALVWPPRGTRGFGFDPVFMPDGHAITFGEMDPAEKDRISHRAVSFAKLVAACFDGAADG